MAEPIREQIQAAVADRLTTIQAGTLVKTYTYWATPTVVTRALLSIVHYKVELETGPVLGVTRATGSLLASQAQPKIYSDLYRFTVEGYVRERGDVLAATWLERSWEDHVRCLLDDPWLGTLVLDLRPDTTETDDGDLEPAAWFRQGWIAELSRAWP